MKPALAITLGDINGIGPEIVVKAVRQDLVRELCRPVVFGSAPVLRAAAASLNLPFELPAFVSLDEALAAEAAVYDPPMDVPPYRPGVLDPEAGRCAMAWFREAVDAALAGKVGGIVTCPINKEGWHRAGFTCSGHTDLIAELTGAKHYSMSLFAGPMRVAHITGHLSLRDALHAVRKERIVETVELAHEALERLGLDRKRIAVAGLNPHAGEGGAFGREEIDEVQPAVEECQRRGYDCAGPIPGDTVFRRMRNGEFDMVVALYHDQGHIPMKLIAMEQGVNITLGLPIVRTSVDHGTAYDIAGSGTADEGSLVEAIRLAAQLAPAPVDSPT